MLSIIFPSTYLFYNWKFVPFDTFIQFPPPQSVLCIYEFGAFRSHL